MSVVRLRVDHKPGETLSLSASELGFCLRCGQGAAFDACGGLGVKPPSGFA